MMEDTGTTFPTPSPKRTPQPFHGLDHLVRTLVRPVLTVGGAAVWVFGFLAGREVPESYVAIVLGSWGWWFAERAIKNLRK